MNYAQLLDDLRALKGGDAWREIAYRAGVSYFTLQRIVSTGRSPRIHTVERIAAALEQYRREQVPA